MKKTIFFIWGLIVIASLLSIQFKSYARAEDREIEVLISPESPKIGDSVSLKIKAVQEESSIPKVFFEKTKLPVFRISKEWYRTLIPFSASSKPGKNQIEVYYLKQVKRVDLLVQSTKYPLENLTLSKQVAGLKASKIEKDLVNKALSVVSAEKFWKGEFLTPSTARQSTVYGVKRRVNGVIDPDYFHKGLDFAAPQGGDIKAPEAGKVILVGLEPKGFVVNGNCIFLDHGNGVITAYLHLSKILVKEGQLIKKGELIGKVGATGIASGPHLHWGIYIYGMTVDPTFWMKNIVE